MKHSLFLILTIIYSVVLYIILQRAYEDEPFFFQVSPKRKLCMEEQVLPVHRRSCFCCGKGTTGGYPARYVYPDLISPTNGWDWTRVDAYGDDESKTPPTDKC